jgi:hypothetical protein
VDEPDRTPKGAAASTDPAWEKRISAPFSAETVVAGNCGSSLLSLVKVVALPAYGHLESVTPDASLLVPVSCGAEIGMTPAFDTSEVRDVVH